MGNLFEDAAQRTYQLLPGSDYAPGSGFSSDGLPGSFTVGLQNVREEDVKLIEQV